MFRIYHLAVPDDASFARIACPKVSVEAAGALARCGLPLDTRNGSPSRGRAAEACRPRRLYCVRCLRRRSGSGRRHFLASTLALGRVPPRLGALVPGSQSGFGDPAAGQLGVRCWSRLGRNVRTGSTYTEAPRAGRAFRDWRAD